MLCLIAGLPCITTPAAAATPTADPATSAAATPEETSASEQAQATGQPVLVPADTTETQTVVANPEGTFTLHANAAPVRAQLPDGTWAPIDTTLHTTAAGRLSPANTAQDMSFSAGGDGPLVTLNGAGAAADKQVALSWPTALPAPTVAGDTATYHNVYPGVDLQMIAQNDAYNEILVVHDAAAATNPALQNLKLSVAGQGVTVTSDATNGLVGTDPATGDTIFRGSPAIAWDSTPHTNVGTGASSDDTGGATVTPLEVDNSTPATSTQSGTVVSDTAVSVAVPSSTLTGPGVTYPVYIDPSMTGTGNYAVVLSGGAPYYNDSTQHPKVGYCGWTGCNGIGTARAYFSLGTSTLANRATTAHIYSADFNITQIHNAAGCTSEPVDLYTSGAFNSGITWGGPITSFLQEVSANYSDTCSTSPANRIHFNSSAVVGFVQTGANNDWPTVSFAFKAPNESDAYQWKQFNADAELDVSYDFPPSTPGSLAVSGALACSGKPIYTTDSTPVLAARAVDNNPSPSNVGLYFQIYTNPAGASALRYNPTRVLDPSNTTVTWTNNSSNTNSTAPLADGNYAYRVQGYTGSPPQYSAYSSWYIFTLDTVAPATPTISSFDYPAGTWGAPQGAPGVFHLTSSGAAAFAYAFDSSSNLVNPTSADCTYTSATKRWMTATGGAASLTAPSLTPGPHTLYVKSFDDAHNVSGVTSYSFYVAPTVANEGATRLEAESLPVTPGPNDSVAASAGSTWSNGYEERLMGSGGTESTPEQFTFSFSTAVEADYALGVQVTSQNDAGILAFELDGQPVTSNGSRVEFDGYSPSTKASYVALGGQHLQPTAADGSTITHTITVDVVGQNASSTGSTAGVDFFTVVPINNVTAGCPAGATDVSQCLAQAMNNNGIAVDNTTPANIGPSADNAGISEQALTAAGFGPGQTVTVDSGTAAQATFTMPTNTAGTPDNVIADGQSIPLPQATLANNVDLLVLSTCGSTAVSLSTQFLVNYDDGAYTTKLLPSIGDWNAAPLANAGPSSDTGGRTLVATLSYRDVGTAADTSHQVAIYHVQIPVDYTDDPVTSVTLPSTGADFTNACTTPTLHVLAMTTS